MADDLKILITGQLNTGATIGQINTALRGIEKKINALKLNVEINDKVLGTLNKFTDQMKKISNAALNTGKVIEEAINPDGSRIKRTYYDGLKGEFSEISKAAKQSAQDQLKSLDEVEAGYNKVIKTVERLNAEGKTIGQTVTLGNGNDTRTVNLNNQGQVLGYSDTTNTAKDEQETQKLIVAKEKLRQELVKLGQAGNVTSSQLANIAKVVNNSGDLKGIEQAKTDLVQLQDQAKLAEQMAQGRERATIARQQAEMKADTSQQQTINKNLELMRQEEAQEKALQSEIERRLVLYQREKQIQAANMQSNYGSNLNQSALNAQMNTINSATANQFRSLQDLRNFEQEANTGMRELTVGLQTASSHARTFGDNLKTAFGSFGTWMIGTTALMQTLNFFREGISFVDNLNKSLTEISIVTYKNQEQVSALGEQYNKLAQQMGVTTTDIAQEAAELYRQGLTTDQVTERMKIITEYAKISSLDTKSASEIMTAAINSMGISATKAADTWAYLGDATATGKHMCPLLQ